MARRTARPRLGQHFLRDRRILGRLAASLPISPGSLVVEIGPGRGALTEHLLARGARVVALEIDEGLAVDLRDKYAGSEGLEVLVADVLDVDFAEIAEARSDEPALIAGNLPYYITSPILRKIFDAGQSTRQATLLMQEEVARRVVARKGMKDYAFLSVLCRLYSEPELLFRVPPRAFSPPPKVTSAAVRLTMRRREQPEPAFVDFLKRCFQQPRKILLNNLSGAYDRSALAGLEISGRRAQQLDLEELQELWEAVRPYRRSAS